MKEPDTEGHIRILPPELARKIAAGEVVDRPAALVRELTDNAIDAGADQIELSIENGGIRRVELTDNGCGMNRTDLELCRHPHATSKISSIADLESAETLGFRGEALAAVAAVANLEILSSIDGREGWMLRSKASEAGVQNGRPAQLERSQRARGTSVRVLGLFDSIPARKKFLKREASEALLCKQAFLDKAMTFPSILFRYFQDGQMKFFLPPGNTYKDRFFDILHTAQNETLHIQEKEFLHEIHCPGPSFSIDIVVGGPELYRRDRRHQYIFTNGRRIQDFGLLQALEYGVQGWFPNGMHPIGAIFIDIDPVLTDFNIHPAKREIRFKDPGSIHHCISSQLRSFLQARGLQQQYSSNNEERSHGFSAEKALRQFPLKLYDRQTDNTRKQAGAQAMEALLDRAADFVPKPGREHPSPLHDEVFKLAASEQQGSTRSEAAGTENDGSIRYIGRLFGLFLLAEKDNSLYIVDQHAAHERLLYDRFKTSNPVQQELLVPISFSTETDEDEAFLQEHADDLAKLGIQLEYDGAQTWNLTALPAAWKKADSDTIQAILSLKESGSSISDEWMAMMACRSAVKDGDYLDDDAALQLIQAAFELEQPRCPHGRPIWTELSRSDLFKAVRRSD